MSSPVKLYVYDLSRGMARQMSLQLTGRHIDGIWHTSIVVFGKEIWYGQGINSAAPGHSHHGQPLQILDMGETLLDEETFNEYIHEIRSHYTADKYHLLDFNCNSFTDDCISFLTGGSIPQYIKDLPTDFLSTPFGASLRPSIDAMYRRPTNTPPPARPQAPSAVPGVSEAEVSSMASTLLQAVAAQAQRPNGTVPSSSSAAARAQAHAPTDSLTSPIHLTTNPTSFHALLKNHRAVVAFFTSKTCPPCRMIEPVFEQLASEKSAKAGQPSKAGAVFAKIDLGVGMAGMVANEYSVRVTPTFMFFLDGKKIEEMKGASPHELRTQVDLLLFQANPPHPHKSLSISALQSVSLNPILYSQVPPFDTVNTKLLSFVDSSPALPGSATMTKDQIKQTISSEVLPFLKSRFPSSDSKGKTPSVQPPPALLQKWAQATAILSNALPLESLFPLVDLWRVAILDSNIGMWASTSPMSPLKLFLFKATTTESTTFVPRNLVLTLLRLLSNAFATPGLARTFVHPGAGAASVLKESITKVVVNSLLHEDVNVRSAAAGLAFNFAAFIQKQRQDGSDQGEDEDWEVELLSAIVEAIEQEKGSEDVVHRLVASLGLLLYTSPLHDNCKSLLEVLQAKDKLRGKLVKGGCGSDGVVKKDIRKLVEEVADVLCA
ncbi:hypothetical protein AX16_005277 [Volvariella volvacea WC 439]|nr:hypothetical protein AX16_005277 [Volvariella volvacea WC 439]